MILIIIDFKNNWKELGTFFLRLSSLHTEINITKLN